MEGGGALINQAIHQADILLYLIGEVSAVTGVIQASTAIWPGYTERIEIHGVKGRAIISGDRLTTWDHLAP